MYITNCKKVSTAIRRATKVLKEQASKEGIYENFGQAEVRAIEDAFIDISSYTNEMNKRRQMVQSFSDWCATYNGTD